MIENETQLEQTRRAIAELEDAIRSLKTRMLPRNPKLFQAMVSDYVTTIHKLRADVNAYIAKRSQIELFRKEGGELINVGGEPQ